MIVIDASAMVEALIGRDAEANLLDGLAGEVAAPHLLDVEVLSVLRRLVLADKLGLTAADEARCDHFAFSIDRHDTQPLAERVWELRHRYTSYDACYIALAEALDAPLYTCDAKLDADSHDAKVHVFPRAL